MKKLQSLLLAFSIIITFSACAGNADTDAQESVVMEAIASTTPEESRAGEAARPDDGEPGAGAEGSGEAEKEQQAAAAPEPEPQGDDAAEAGRTLVVYISHTGTTEAVAGHITDAIAADVFVIEPANAYPGSYNEHLDVAQQELNDDARPAIQATVSNMEVYDTILLGYPIWWGYAPRPVATFLESHDLTGKTIAPFCTSGSSGMGRSADEIAELAPGAQVVSGLSITGSNTADGPGLVRDWLTGLGLL